MTCAIQPTLLAADFLLFSALSSKWEHKVVPRPHGVNLAANPLLRRHNSRELTGGETIHTAAASGGREFVLVEIKVELVPDSNPIFVEKSTLQLIFKSLPPS